MIIINHTALDLLRIYDVKHAMHCIEVECVMQHMIVTK